MHPNVCFGVYQPSLFYFMQQFLMIQLFYGSLCSGKPRKDCDTLVHGVTNRKCSIDNHFWRLTLGVGLLAIGSWGFFFSFHHYVSVCCIWEEHIYLVVKELAKLFFRFSKKLNLFFNHHTNLMIRKQKDRLCKGALLCNQT